MADSAGEPEAPLEADQEERPPSADQDAKQEPVDDADADDGSDEFASFQGDDEDGYGYDSLPEEDSDEEAGEEAETVEPGPDEGAAAEPSIAAPSEFSVVRAHMELAAVMADYDEVQRSAERAAAEVEEPLEGAGETEGGVEEFDPFKDEQARAARARAVERRRQLGLGALRGGAGLAMASSAPAVATAFAPPARVERFSGEQRERIVASMKALNLTPPGSFGLPGTDSASTRVLDALVAAAIQKGRKMLSEQDALCD